MSRPGPPGASTPAPHDPAGAAAAVHPLVAAARDVAERVLAPAAAATDQAALVPRAHLDALARAGLYGLAGPRSHGGADAPPAVRRAVTEALAGACGPTTFIWLQHQTPMRLLAGSGNAELRERLLPGMCSGARRAGVAFAYLRRPGPPAVAVRPVAGGWRLAGEAPWVTGWGLVDLLVVAAGAPGERVVWAVVPAREEAGLVPSGPLRLAAMGASGTVRLRFDGVAVAAGDVVAVEPLALWRERDALAAAQPNPAVLGVAAACVRLLREQADATGDRQVAALAASLAGELAECRGRAAAPAEAPASAGAGAAALAAMRAWALELALRAAGALLAASGGRGMALGHPAQRLLREAAFYSVQAQTAAGREATLQRLLRAWPAAPAR